MGKKVITLILLLFSGVSLYSQLQVSVTTYINTVCNGNPCNYNGPTILINEVMMSPATGDGSMYDTDSTRRGEWIELYNPDICNSIDISCYFLGNNTNDQGGFDFGGGFILPQGAIVPPSGFVLIRGENAPPVPSNLLIQNGGNTIEIVVGGILVHNICLGGNNRLWFPNNGGWFAFYDQNGVPQDAISWCSTVNSCMSCEPCNPLLYACGYLGSLPSYDNIPANKKNYITTLNPSTYLGQSFRRIPDGGGWVSIPSIPTMGNCNQICAPLPNISCNGMAVAVATGGLSPYTYKWNDQQNTINDTVTGLCSGFYTVKVKDANNDTTSLSVFIDNLDLNTTVTSTSVSCLGGNNGSATAVVTNGTQPYHFYWSNGDLTSIINQLSSGNYSVTVTDTNDCISIDTVLVPVDSVELKIMVNDPSVCLGAPVVVNAIPNIPGGVYLWTPGNNQTSSVSFTPQTSGLIVVQYSIAGCTASDTSYITVNQPPLAKILPSNASVLIGDSIVLLASGGYRYLWNTGDTAIQIIKYPQNDTIYCLIAESMEGCLDSTCYPIDVILNTTLYVPNAFTPNDDGRNDLFMVKGTDLAKFYIVIYNRWGELMYESMDINQGWDGRFKGEFVQSGVYAYSIEAVGKDYRSYKKAGAVAVIR